MRTKRLYKVTVVEGDVVTILNYRAYNKKDVRVMCKRDMVGRQRIKEIVRIQNET